MHFPPHRSVHPTVARRALAALLLCASAALAACSGERQADADSAAAIAEDVPPDADAAANGCASGARPAIESRGVGPVRLGASLGELPVGCTRRDTVLAAEGMEQPGAVVGMGGRPVVAEFGERGEVWRIAVRDSTLRTAAGVGVGSMVADLRRAYGAVCALVGEGRVFAVAPALPGVSFETTEPVARAAAGATRLADTARVTMVLVHGTGTNCPPMDGSGLEGRA